MPVRVLDIEGRFQRVTKLEILAAAEPALEQGLLSLDLDEIRLGDPPSRPALDPDQQAELTAEFMLRYADSTVRWNQQAYDKPVNSLEFKIDRDTDGALRNQVYILGHFDLDDDQALVVDVNTGGAGYFIAPITNCWGTTNEIVHRTGSLNLAQSVAMYPNAQRSGRR